MLKAIAVKVNNGPIHLPIILRDNSETFMVQIIMGDRTHRCFLMRTSVFSIHIWDRYALSQKVIFLETHSQSGRRDRHRCHSGHRSDNTRKPSPCSRNALSDALSTSIIYKKRKSVLPKECPVSNNLFPFFPPPWFGQKLSPPCVR